MRSQGVPVTIINHGISYEEYLTYHNDSKISLCFTNNSVMSRKQNKGRTVEIMNYAVMASEEWPDMEIMDMEPNKDFILLDYTNTKWLEVIDQVLNDDQFRNEMFVSGRNKLINSNTVFHRWDKVMSQIDEDYNGTDFDEIVLSYVLPNMV